MLDSQRRYKKVAHAETLADSNASHDPLLYGFPESLRRIKNRQGREETL